MGNNTKNHVLFVIQNNSVPCDAHVWNEANIIRKTCNNATIFKINSYESLDIRRNNKCRTIKYRVMQKGLKRNILH